MTPIGARTHADSQVIFIATPHTGSRKATWLDRARVLTQSTIVADMLATTVDGPPELAHDPTMLPYANPCEAWR